MSYHPLPTSPETWWWWVIARCLPLQTHGCEGCDRTYGRHILDVVNTFTHDLAQSPSEREKSGELKRRKKEKRESYYKENMHGSYNYNVQYTGNELFTPNVRYILSILRSREWVDDDKGNAAQYKKRTAQPITGSTSQSDLKNCCWWT